jgi:hypothetical protein
MRKTLDRREGKKGAGKERGVVIKSEKEYYIIISMALYRMLHTALSTNGRQVCIAVPHIIVTHPSLLIGPGS